MSRTLLLNALPPSPPSPQSPPPPPSLSPPPLPRRRRSSCGCTSRASQRASQSTLCLNAGGAPSSRPRVPWPASLPERAACAPRLNPSREASAQASRSCRCCRKSRLRSRAARSHAGRRGPCLAAARGCTSTASLGAVARSPPRPGRHAGRRVPAAHRNGL
eukprot:5219599-Pleurochrysis_carterae.AAC.1